jgi:hypothetical protein
MPGKPLKDAVVAIAGTLSCSHSSFEELIIKNGGEFSAGISQRVTHLVSTKEEIKTNSPKVKKAMFQEIPIVSESFIRDSIAKGKLQEEEKYTLRTDDYVIDEDDFIEDDDELISDAEPESESESDDGGDAKPGLKRKRSGSGAVKAKKPKTSTPKKPPVTEADFFNKAKDLSIEFQLTKGKKTADNNFVFQAPRKKFSSGSLGWGLAGKTLKVTIDGHELTAQISANLVIRGSKPKKEKTAETPAPQSKEEEKPELEEESGTETLEPEEPSETRSELTDSREMPNIDLNLPDVLENLEQMKDEPVYQEATQPIEEDEPEPPKASGWSCHIQ